MLRKFFNFLISLFFVFAISEVIFYCLLKHDVRKKTTLITNKTKKEIPIYDYSNAYPNNQSSPYYHTPNTSMNAVFKIKNGREIYNIDYDVDSYSRRKGLNQKKEKHILFFGGSFVFGEGVAGNETLPSRFTFYSKEYQAYNFGVRGAAVNDLFVNFKKYKNLRMGIKEKEGVVVYLFYEFHFKRLISYILNLHPKIEGYPNEKIFKTEVTNPLTLLFNKNGVFQKSLPYKETNLFSYRIKSFLSKSSTLRYFKIGIPLYWNSIHFKYLENILLNLHAEAKSAFGSKDIYLIIGYPFKHNLRKRLKDFFINSNSKVKVIDVNDLKFSKIVYEDYSHDELFIRGDGHPTARYYDILAKSLVGEFE